MSGFKNSAVSEIETAQFITIKLNGQLFGISVEHVKDILKDQAINKIPLAPPYIKGSINLRGKIVTAIDVKQKINVTGSTETAPLINIVIEYQDELYSLLVDEVEEVLTLKKSACEANPTTLDKTWQKISQGIYQLEKELLIILDIQKLFTEAS